MEMKRINSYLGVMISFLVLATSCGEAWASSASCKYTKSGTEIEGSGIGGTGIIAGGTGMGGTGSRPDTEGMQIAGIVAGSEGTVEAQRSGNSRALAVNDPVCVGETLVSSDLGRVQIKMIDGGSIEIRPRTTLKIEKLIYTKTEKDSSLIALLDGSCRFVTGEIGKRYPQNDLILTPNGMIGVRGTDHEATVILHGENERYPSGTYDKVNSGITFINTEKGEVDIHPAQVGFAANAEELPILLNTIPEFYDGNPAIKQEGNSAVESDKEKDIGVTNKLNQPAEAQTPSGGPHESQQTIDHVETPALPERPDIMERPELPELPEVPELPEIPELPEVPEQIVPELL